MRFARDSRVMTAALGFTGMVAVASIGASGNAADDDGERSARSTADLLALANDYGALGVYFEPNASAVVVMPSGRAKDFPIAEAVRLGLPVEVETATMTAETVASITDDLLALRRTIARDVGYAFYFDLRKAVMVVQTDSTADVFAVISSKYGSDVQIVSNATGGQTSGRQADTSPFWGGARLNASGSCSSGFVAKSATTTYMSTAGHCWAVGTSVTSGGVPLREQSRCGTTRTTKRSSTPERPTPLRSTMECKGITRPMWRSWEGESRLWGSDRLDTAGLGTTRDAFATGK